MRIFAISDLHLDGNQNKSMEVFGSHWAGHWEKIRNNWKAVVSEEDYVLVSGDISWAMKLDDAVSDFEQMRELPGNIVMIKGNHDFWHDSLSKTVNALPERMYFLQNDTIVAGEYTIAGTRLWKQRNEEGFTDEDEKIYQRELIRLKLSLDRTHGKKTIVMTHYPPYSVKKESTEFTDLISKYNVEKVIFGHIHGFIRPDLKKSSDDKISSASFEATIDGIPYILTSCDYIDFTPVQLF